MVMTAQNSYLIRFDAVYIFKKISYCNKRYNEKSSFFIF